MRIAAVAALLGAWRVAAAPHAAVECVASNAALALVNCTALTGPLRLSSAASAAAPLLRELRGPLQITSAAAEAAAARPRRAGGLQRLAKRLHLDGEGAPRFYFLGQLRGGPRLRKLLAPQLYRRRCRPSCTGS